METMWNTACMAPTKKNPLGPTGEVVAAKVERMRTARNLSYAELSRQLDAVGRRIPVLGLQKIEKCERRVDVDDLVALALVFDVSPITLLMPAVEDEEAMVAMTGAGDVSAGRVWRWLLAQLPRPDLVPVPNVQTILTFLIAARPTWDATMAMPIFSGGAAETRQVPVTYVRRLLGADDDEEREIAISEMTGADREEIRRLLSTVDAALRETNRGDD